MTTGVDVAIVTYNSRELTTAAIGHLLDATGDVDVRVLVHDNASSDGTADAIRAAFPSVEVEAGDENLGFAGGVNRILARVDRPFVLLLNSDAWPEPGAVARLLEAASAHPRAAVVAPRVERPDGSLEVSAFPFPSIGTAVACLAPRAVARFAPDAAEDRLLPGAFDHASPRRIDWALGAALLVRTEALLDVGPFEERFFMYAEELEWQWRAAERGWEVRFEPAAVVRHVGGATAMRTLGATRREQAAISNSLSVYRDRHGAVGTAAYRAVSVAGTGLLWARAKLRGDAAAAGHWATHVRTYARPG